MYFYTILPEQYTQNSLQVHITREQYTKEQFTSTCVQIKLILCVSEQVIQCGSNNTEYISTHYDPMRLCWEID